MQAATILAFLFSSPPPPSKFSTVTAMRSCCQLQQWSGQGEGEIERDGERTARDLFGSLSDHMNDW